MAIYGKLVENYYQGLDFVYEFNQFDLMMESVNNFDIVLEAFSFNDIIEKLKQLWSKFKGWVKEKFKQLKEFIKKILNKNKQMNEEKVEDNKEDNNKEEKDKEEEKSSQRKSYIEIKYEYYKSKGKLINTTGYGLWKYSSNQYYLNYNIDHLNSKNEKINNVKEFSKKFTDQAEEKINDLLRRTKEDYIPEKITDSIECNYGSRTMLKYAMRKIKENCETMKEDILSLSESTTKFEKDINEYEKELDKLIEQIKGYQETLKRDNNRIKDIKNNNKKNFEEDLEYFKKIRDTKIYSDYDSMRIKEEIKDMSDEELEKCVKSIRQSLRLDFNKKFYKNDISSTNEKIKEIAVKINLIKWDISKFRDIILAIANINMDIGQAMLKNQSVHGKLMKLYKSDKFPENDIEITIE